MKDLNALAALKGRSLLRDVDLTPDEFLGLLQLSEQLRREKRSGTETEMLKGKNIALTLEKSSTRTRSAFEVAAHDQGLTSPTWVPVETQLGHKETVKDTARVLDECTTALSSGGLRIMTWNCCPSFPACRSGNGLTDLWHPTTLGDMLTIATTAPSRSRGVPHLRGRRSQQHCELAALRGRDAGLDVRIGAPIALQPTKAVQLIAKSCRHTQGRGFSSPRR